MCWHGCGTTGILMHQLWHCPEVRKFWLNVKEVLCNLFDVKFQLCPTVGLLGSKIEGVTSKAFQHLIALAFLSVKRTILINWKVRKPNCFSIDSWLKDYLDLIAMEDAALALKDLGSGHTGALSLIMSILNKNGD